MSLQSIKKKAIELCKTNNIVQEKKKIKELINKIADLLKKNSIDASILLGGSAAKDTFIGNEFDVDIFVLFNYAKYREKDISSLLGKALKELKPDKVHGSRDYFRFDNKYEIIPVLKIKNYKEVVNVTDASPLHVSWVRKHVKKNPKLKQEIKLTKMFLKAAKIYGAESYIKGLSGHVTDILVIYHGSFIGFLKAASKWKKTTEIDFENHKAVLDKSKIQGPLTVVDPIQPNRNAAAAVDYKAYEKLKKKAKEFLKNPALDFFIEKPIDLSRLKDKYNLILKLKPLNGKSDVVGAKLMKGFEFAYDVLVDFNIQKAEWLWDKEKVCYYCFKLKKTQLEKEFVKQGPSKDYPRHIVNFKKKYKKTFIKGNIVYAKVKRSLLTPNDLLENYCQKKYFKDKIASWCIVK
ncbi:MAG: nucleotidyltransferase domain-containing protein [Candidatus Woesearchaeota archaeon]